ncbi:hypothetical protein RvY_03600-3 [Ramazzottius varieornatus]|uniref:Thyrotropin-releasing hormone receptor n=1 Tax=Ramazzottius varieornatus TaxID=947166 RepID=A0A1D1UVS7_RAMVA|nr:hypothetical protein RvY_03600-3 [Ramazzottius varieornatus]
MANISVPGNLTKGVPESYPLDYRIVATVLHSLIFILGVVGNVCVVIVVRRTPSMRTPTYFYLVSLAIADLVVLVSALPEAVYSYNIYKRQWSFGRFGCSFWVFANFLGINVSSTSILCFTVERYIGICKPLLAQKMCTISRARKIIMAIWLFGVIYSSPWLFLTQTSPYPDHMHMEYCHYRLTRKEYVYFYLADIVLFYVLPLLASITLYVRIAVALRISILHMPGKVTITRSYSPASSNSNLARPLTVRSPQAWRKHNYRNTDEKRAVVQVRKTFGKQTPQNRFHERLSDCINEKVRHSEKE